MNRRKLTAIGLASLLFAGCAKEGTSPVALQSGLSFDTSMAEVFGEWSSPSQVGEGGGLIISMSGAPAGEASTKAAPSDEAPTTFSVSGYRSSDGSFNPSKGDVEILTTTGTEGSGSYTMRDETISSTLISQEVWDNAGTDKFRFYAWAPVGYATLKEDGPAPILSVTPSTDVTKQADFMEAVSSDYASTAKESVSLEFKHVMAGIKFSVGTLPYAYTVTKVSLVGVYTGGSRVVGGSWAVDETKTGDYTIDGLSAKVEKTDDVITDKENTFMLIPQTFPEGAEIYYEFTLDGATISASGDLSGVEIKEGMMYTFKLSIPESEESKYNFFVSDIDGFGWDSETQSFGIASFMSYDNGYTEPIAWTATFSDTENGTYTSELPAWIESMEISGEGGVNITSVDITSKRTETAKVAYVKFSNGKNDDIVKKISKEANYVFLVCDSEGVTLTAAAEDGTYSGETITLSKGSNYVPGWEVQYGFRVTTKNPSISDASFAYWDASNVVTLNEFMMGTGVGRINLTGLEAAAANVKDLSGFFTGSSVSSIDLSALSAYTGVTSLYGFLQGCNKLTEVDLSPLKNMGQVTTLEKFLQGCTGLTTVNLGPLASMTKNTTLKSFMSGCTGLTSLSLAGLGTQTLVTDMSYFLAGCTSLTEDVDFSIISDITNVTTLEGFMQFVPVKNVSFYYNDFSKVRNITDMFKNDVDHFKMETLNFGMLFYFYDETVEDVGDFLDDGSGLLLQNTKVLTTVKAAFSNVLNTQVTKYSEWLYDYVVERAGTSLSSSGMTRDNYNYFVITLTY